MCVAQGGGWGVITSVALVHMFDAKKAENTGRDMILWPTHVLEMLRI